MSKIYLPNSTQLDTLNEKVGAIGDTLAGQQLVTKDAVVSALGYEPEIPIGAYELLNEVTVDEAVVSFKITQDSNGNALKLKHMYVDVYGDGTSTGAASVSVTSTSGEAYIYLGGFPRSQTKISSKIWGDVNGNRLAFFYNQYTTDFTPIGHQFVMNSFDTPQYITGISIYAGQKITVGLTLKIYGIRA